MAGTVSIHASVKDATYWYVQSDFTFSVSIHASVKDATKKTYNKWITTDVSIHASVKDATDIKTTLNDLFVSFNPRIRKGCDSTFNSGGTLRPVSIHASVKDATSSQKTLIV